MKSLVIIRRRKKKFFVYSRRKVHKYLCFTFCLVFVLLQSFCIDNRFLLENNLYKWLSCHNIIDASSFLLILTCLISTTSHVWLFLWTTFQESSNTNPLNFIMFLFSSRVFHLVTTTGTHQRRKHHYNSFEKYNAFCIYVYIRPFFLAW